MTQDSICKSTHIREHAHLLRCFAGPAVLAAAFAAIVSVSIMPSIAWGPLSHMAVSIEAGAKGDYPVSADLLGAYLAGTTEPDIGLGDGVSEDYGVYHSDEFAQAMERVADTLKSPQREILRARALGMRSHIAADAQAHGQTGYSNAKPMFESMDYGLPRHTTNELCTDLLSYRDNRAAFRKAKLDFIDPETLALVRDEYARTTGKELKADPAALKKEVLTHKAMVLTEVALAEHMAAKNPEKLDQMAVPYSDLRQGYKGGGGFDSAVASVQEKIRGLDELTTYKNRNIGAKLRELAVETLPGKGMQSLEKGVLTLMGHRAIRDRAVSFADPKVAGSDRNRAFLHLGSNLLDPNLTFEQAVFKSGSAAFGEPDSPEAKLAYLRMEASIIRDSADRAREKYEGRPFWKVWLYFTNSDRRKWEALEAEHAAKLSEIAALEATIAGSAILADEPGVRLPGDSAPAGAEEAQAHSNTSLAFLKTQVDAASQRLSEALQSGSAQTADNARRALESAKARLAAAVEMN